MEVDTDINDNLASIASLANQRDRTASYLDFLHTILALTPPAPAALISYGRHFILSSSMAAVVGRRVLDAFVTALCAGSGMEKMESMSVADSEEGVGAEERWENLGKIAFSGEKGMSLRKEAVDGLLSNDTTGGWCDEQVSVLRHLQSHLLQLEEDWVGAARVLMQIPLEGGSRLISDEEKLKVYMKIVRLCLESGESGLAQNYFSRASLLIHITKDKETQLAYKLSQARIFDYSARFNEAAQRYHELSFDGAIDEDDRMHMLKAAVTTSILAPAGPQRSRVLASLNRDDRVVTSLPAHLPTMLKKMLLEYIVRPEEVKEFEQGLEDHQRATVEGGGTVLERAVREHNVGACSKVYDNVSFEALGTILNLDSEAAEATARRMIEQGRLRAWIDQPLHLLYFESRSAHDTDAEAQGTAGGLGVEREEKEIEPMSWTERWDNRIRATSMQVEAIASAIQTKGLIPA